MPQVWGRDDDGGGLAFAQKDINRIVELASHRGSAASFYPMKAGHGQAVLALCVSEVNKELLLNAPGFVPLLMDSLLLDPEHPRRDNVTMMGTTDFEAVKGPVQRVSCFKTHLVLCTCSF